MNIHLFTVLVSKDHTQVGSQEEQCPPVSLGFLQDYKLRAKVGGKYNFTVRSQEQSATCTMLYEVERREKEHQGHKLTQKVWVDNEYRDNQS